MDLDTQTTQPAGDGASGAVSTDPQTPPAPETRTQPDGGQPTHESRTLIMEDGFLYPKVPEHMAGEYGRNFYQAYHDAGRYKQISQKLKDLGFESDEAFLSYEAESEAAPDAQPASPSGAGAAPGSQDPLDLLNSLVEQVQRLEQNLSERDPRAAIEEYHRESEERIRYQEAKAAETHAVEAALTELGFPAKPQTFEFGGSQIELTPMRDDVVEPALQKVLFRIADRDAAMNGLARGTEAYEAFMRQPYTAQQVQEAAKLIGPRFAGYTAAVQERDATRQAQIPGGMLGEEPGSRATKHPSERTPGEVDKIVEARLRARRTGGG